MWVHLWWYHPQCDLSWCSNWQALTYLTCCIFLYWVVWNILLTVKYKLECRIIRKKTDRGEFRALVKLYFFLFWTEMNEITISRAKTYIWWVVRDVVFLLFGKFLNLKRVTSVKTRFTEGSQSWNYPRKRKKWDTKQDWQSNWHRRGQLEEVWERTEHYHRM